MSDEQLLTAKQAATHVGLTEGAITSAIRALKLRSRLVEGRRYVTLADLDEWRERTAPPGSTWRRQQRASYRGRNA